MDKRDKWFIPASVSFLLVFVTLVIVAIYIANESSDSYNELLALKETELAEVVATCQQEHLTIISELIESSEIIAKLDLKETEERLLEQSKQNFDCSPSIEKARDYVGTMYWIIVQHDENP